MGKEEQSSKEGAKIQAKDPGQGSRVSGKWWKHDRKAFRINSLGLKSSWKKKQAARMKDKEFKERLNALKQEKEDEWQAHTSRIKERRKKAAENERYEYLATKMHRKKLERLKRREKRNKMLQER